MTHECVILVRMPNGKVTAIMDGEELAILRSLDAAVDLMEHHILKDQPYQIVELGEI